jgi:prepilin peptidase CpaA
MFANLFVSQTVLVAFGGLLVATAIQDIRQLTIPNRYCLAVALLYPVYVLTSVQGVDWLDGALVGGISLGVGFLLFAMRLAGAGDVKFFAAISLWTGNQLILEFVMITAIVGGVIATAMLIHRRLTAPAKPRPTVAWPARVFAAINVFLGSLLMERPRGAVAAGAAAGPAAATAAGDPGSESVPPVGTLPYGAAIATGGLVVAAMLLMRG